MGFLFVLTEEYGQYYGQMNTMAGHPGGRGGMMTVKRDGLPYEEMGYCPPPNRKLPPVPGQHSNYNTIDRLKNGKPTKPSRSLRKTFYVWEDPFNLFVQKISISPHSIL